MILEAMSAASETQLNYIAGIGTSLQRLEGQPIPVSIEMIKIAVLVEETVACSKMAGPQSNCVQYEISLAEEVAAEVYSDACILRRNLTNLLCNAGRATSRGTIKIRVDVSLPVSCTVLSNQKLLNPNQTYLRFVVEDTGTGFAMGEEENAWEPFVSLAGSTGLGLFVVRTQCEAMRGACGIEPRRVVQRGGKRQAEGSAVMQAGEEVEELENEGGSENGPGCVVWFCVPYHESMPHSPPLAGPDDQQGQGQGNGIGIGSERGGRGVIPTKPEGGGRRGGYVGSSETPLPAQSGLIKDWRPPEAVSFVRGGAGYDFIQTSEERAEIGGSHTLVGLNQTRGGGEVNPISNSNSISPGIISKISTKISTKISRSGVSLLLIDDTLNVLEMHALHLEVAGYNVTKALGPIRGIQMLKDRRCVCHIDEFEFISRACLFIQ